MIFYTFLCTKIGEIIDIELKNDLKFSCKLLSLDQFLNLKVNIINILDNKNFLEIANSSLAYIRGSSIKLIKMKSDTEIEKKISDASRYRFIINRNLEEKKIQK